MRYTLGAIGIAGLWGKSEGGSEYYDREDDERKERIILPG